MISASYISFQGITLNIKEMNVTENIKILKEKRVTKHQSQLLQKTVYVHVLGTQPTGYRMSTKVCCPVPRSDLTISENDIPTHPSTKTHPVSVLPKYDTEP